MIESPLIQELLAEQAQRYILIFLEGRFATVPEDIKAAVEGIEDIARLEKLLAWAGGCTGLDEFRSRMAAETNKP